MMIEKNPNIPLRIPKLKKYFPKLPGFFATSLISRFPRPQKDNRDPMVKYEVAIL